MFRYFILKAIIVLSNLCLAQTDDDNLIYLEGTAEYINKSFFSADSIKKSTRYKLFIDNNSYAYISSSGVAQNMSDEYLESFNTTPKDFWDKPQIFNFYPSENPFEKQTLFVSHDTVYEDNLIDSAFMYTYATIDSMFYKSKMFMSNYVQSRQVYHLANTKRQASYSEMQDALKEASHRREAKNKSVQSKSNVDHRKPVIKISDLDCLDTLDNPSKSIIISFWYRGCIACNLLIKQLNHQNKILLLNGIDSDTEQKEYLKQFEVSLPWQPFDCYFPSAYPTTIHIKSGEIKNVWVGYSEDIMNEIISVIK